jgi:phenylacetate-CoA ligase
VSALTDRIYRVLPAWGQDLAISAYGVKYRQERLGGDFREYVAGFRERDSWRPVEMDAYVASALRRTLAHAFDQVPYYREKWRAAGIRRQDLERILPGELPMLPATPKEDLRRAPEAFVAEDARAKGGLHRYYTSGSTGTPLTVICTSDAHRRFIAARDVRSFGWAGASIQLPRAMLGGRMVVPDAGATGRMYRYNFVERQVYFSAYHIRPDTVASYVEGFNRYRPLLLTGYAHSYYFLARLMLSKGRKLEYEPRCLVLSSEKTTPAMKEAIAEAFRARAYEEYGSVENCALATECEYGSLHISPDFGVVEIVDERGEAVPAGCDGRVLCTGLLNDAQPLIRYEIGDVASWSTVQCQCGRDQLPVLAGVEGRLEDAVIATVRGGPAENRRHTVEERIINPVNT